LSTIVGFKLNDKEREIIDLLSEYIIWVAKYPIPKSEKEMDNYYDKFAKAAVDKTEVENTTFEKYNGALEWEQINAIWTNINKIFVDEYKD